MIAFFDIYRSAANPAIRSAWFTACVVCAIAQPLDAHSDYRFQDIRGVLVVLEGPEHSVADVTADVTLRSALSAAPRPELLFDVPVDPLDQCPDPRAGFSVNPPIRRVLRIPANRAAFGGDRNPWDVAWDRFQAMSSHATTLGAALSLRPQVRVAAVEPDIVWKDDGDESALWIDEWDGATGEGDTHTPSYYADDGWPLPESADWARKASQLDLGLKMVEEKLPSANGLVRIAHFDTGYTPCEDVGLPPKLLRSESRDFTRPVCDAAGACEPGPDPVDHPQSRINSKSHGTGTLSILAGGPARYTPADGAPPIVGPLGGAPFAEVVEYRLTDFVVLWQPSVVSDALHWAADHGADVVSMSLGGPPSLTMHHAVNYAYCRGVAMFAAAGNNFHLPIVPFSTPRTTVFPARYDRVISVGGATADDLSYAQTPWRWRYLWHPFQMVMRGNVGPKHDKAIMDETLVARTPNVPWLDFRDEPCDAKATLRLNGGGTSAATPQAAAAAAQWLQFYRDDRELAANWRTWKKTEAVYRALLTSAQKTLPVPDYNREWFGAGLLQAAAAIETHEPNLETLTIRPRARLRWDWLASMLVSMIGDPSAAALRGGTSPAEDMLRTEIAQLAITSEDLRKALDATETNADAASREDVLELLRNEPAASQKLRGLAAEALRKEGA